MIEAILPPSVAVCEAFDDPADATLFPPEEAIVARAVAKRRREFATGRWCARRALADLGLPATSVPSGARGAPRWPAGVVGSITHCDGYRAAAVARSRHLRTIGIDAEPHAPLPDGVLNLVAAQAEREHLHALAATATDLHVDRLLFSAKESAYKAWFPLTGRWLGFEDVAVTIDVATRGFMARLLVPGPRVNGTDLTGFTGRWLIQNGLIITAVAT